MIAATSPFSVPDLVIATDAWAIAGCDSSESNKEALFTPSAFSALLAQWLALPWPILPLVAPDSDPGIALSKLSEGAALPPESANTHPVNGVLATVLNLAPLIAAKPYLSPPMGLIKSAEYTTTPTVAQFAPKTEGQFSLGQPVSHEGESVSGAEAQSFGTDAVFSELGTDQASYAGQDKTPLFIPTADVHQLATFTDSPPTILQAISITSARAPLPPTDNQAAALLSPNRFAIASDDVGLAESIVSLPVQQPRQPSYISQISEDIFPDSLAPSEPERSFSLIRRQLSNHVEDTKPRIVPLIVPGRDHISYRPESSETPPLHHQIARAISAQLSQTHRESPLRLYLRLEPPELGHVRVELSFRNNHVEAHFQVEQTATHFLLENQRQQLEESLAQLGISVKTMVTSFQGQETRHEHPSEQPGSLPIKKPTKQYGREEPSLSLDAADCIDLLA